MPSVVDSYDVDLLPSLQWLSEVDFVSPPAETLPPRSGEAAHVYPVFALNQVPTELGFSANALESYGFEAGEGDVFTIPSPTGCLSVLVGLGDVGETAVRVRGDHFRTAGAAAGRATARCAALTTSFPAGAAKPDLVEFVSGLLLSRYEFKVTNTDKAASVVPLEEFALVAQGWDAEAVVQVLVEARAEVRAAFVARDLTNASPGHLTPSTFPGVAQRLATDFGFAVRDLDLDDLKDLGCGGIVGVNRGSEHGAHLIRLTYDARRAEISEGVGGETRESGRLALVGKGITFDSGGLSLKPSASMLEMKMDMGGAAAILGAFTAFADLGVATQVDAWLPITDNMISGNSMRVGEIITARNGVTVEVTNTDAEGRLVLMDGLSLAAESNPDWIVDIATLTGAQTVALGGEIAAVLGNDPALIGGIERAGEEVGELVWELPLYGRYLKILSSEVADVANANLKNRNAGTITAGLFLSQFVGDTPWAHLDIAGPMSAPSADRWLAQGATGFGARLLARLAREL